MSNQELLLSIEKMLDKKLEKVEKRFDEKLEAVHKRIDEVHERIDEVHKRIDGMHEQINEVHKRIDEVHERVDEVHKRIDYYHKPLEPSKTELMPLKSVISLSVLNEPTLDWMEEMYHEILRQVKSRKFKGVWINTPKQWYEQTFNLFHQVDDKNLAEVTTWNEINLPK